MKRAEHIGMTEKEFRARKRASINIILNEMKRLTFGCRYMPIKAYKKIQKIETLLNDTKEICLPWWKNA